MRFFFLEIILSSEERGRERESSYAITNTKGLDFILDKQHDVFFV